MWINIADTSAGTGKSGGGLQGEKHEIGGFKPTGPRGGRWLKAPKGYKNKDIIGVSWMLAFALQADGWYFRMDNVWEKTNGMPSSATDRPTKVHEYVFLLSKSKNYYYDGEAISEPSAGWKGSSFTSERDFQRHPNTGRKERKPYKIGLVGERENRGISSGPCTVGRPTRNKRSVWRIATATSDFEDHMATFPEEFANICIKAGSRPGDVIIDPFAGTGTMIEAALKNNRHGIGFELKPSWADGANHSIRGWRTLSNFAMEG
jgi:site-specific DNA-methyltransferase (cytosine-N4-specific)